MGNDEDANQNDGGDHADNNGEDDRAEEDLDNLSGVEEYQGEIQIAGD